MVITEIFKSIQGESTYAGLPCVFVRLTGCNLRCAWCDTAYAFYGGTRMSIDEVLERIHELSGGASCASDGPTPQLRRGEILLVELIGGEPHLQPDGIWLVRRSPAER